jgi:hypothetical protein
MTKTQKPKNSGPKLVSGVIYGKVVSKANSRRKTRSGLYIKSQDGLAFERMALEQIPADLTPIEGDVALIATIYYPSLRQDLDESLVMDVLQQKKDKAKRIVFNGVYMNDRQIKTKIILHELDKENPRVEFTIVWNDLVRKSIEKSCNDIKTMLV